MLGASSQLSGSISMFTQVPALHTCPVAHSPSPAQKLETHLRASQTHMPFSHPVQGPLL